MITAHEALYRGRKGRDALAKVYRAFRAKHGRAETRRLYREIRALRAKAWSPDGDARKYHKPRLHGLAALITSAP